jgi:peroxidase
MATGKCPLTNVLPNPRLVSSTFHTDVDSPAPTKLTQLFTIFAQFVDHDITLSSTYNPPNCCLDASDTDKCAPITVASGDSFFSSGKCLNFVRSLGFCEELDCGTDPINDDTSYVDGSQIYGSDQGNGTQLRAFSSGRLATSGITGNSLLPIVDGAFKAGDIRALENPGVNFINISCMPFACFVLLFSSYGLAL